MTVTAVALTGASQQIRTAPDSYSGYTIRETAGAVAVVRVWDNAAGASAGTLLETVGLAANQSQTVTHARPIMPTAGIWVQVVSGTVEGSIRVGM